jgi:3-deoxy-manno-octulosonate cytidylyltransferase (CMP-KDO synthetase)
MKTLVIIPARYASTRLPGKPLLRETGKYLIQHVVERALQAKSVAGVIVATDDVRIADAVESFGGQAAMTRSDHVSGTDRIAEVAGRIDCEAIVNIQGDEPQFDPAAVDLLTDLLKPDCTMSTLATPIRSAAMYADPNAVTVVCADDGRALYFSRAPIPFHRDGAPDWHSPRPAALLHLGAYAYRRETLLRIARTPPHPLELAEKLEQLRVLAMGGTIRVGVVPEAHRGVDTPEDYAAFVRAVAARPLARAA